MQVGTDDTQWNRIIDLEAALCDARAAVLTVDEMLGEMDRGYEHSNVQGLLALATHRMTAALEAKNQDGQRVAADTAPDRRDGDTGELSPAEHEFRKRVCARLDVACTLAESLREMDRRSDDGTVDGDLVSEIAWSICRRLEHCIRGLGGVPTGWAEEADKELTPNYVEESSDA